MAPTPTTYTVFVLYRALPAWLGLSRTERNEVFARQVGPIFARYEQQVQVRLFDAEAFHADVSDVLLLTTDDLNAYYFFMEALRDTDLFAKPYIVLKDVIMTRENGFRDYETNQP
ncbi:darcynin family protein [Fibrella aquatilis]|uniref:Darcynin 1 n=1 Tax=Fibrella aquatilis TaxID=2817059 RepID=A0A939G868_9BACT|nr:darcynin family protein [Fibrella aquatilis]MBO0931937.1 hypothetical protein [Fibrella aquatilis]